MSMGKVGQQSIWAMANNDEKTKVTQLPCIVGGGGRKSPGRQTGSNLELRHKYGTRTPAKGVTLWCVAVARVFFGTFSDLFCVYI